MLYVTHDQVEAMTLADRIGILEHGALLQVGTPLEIYDDPVSSYVAARLGSPRINVLPRAGSPAACRRRAARPRSASAPDGIAAAPANGHDSGHARAHGARASSTWATSTTCTSALGGATRDIELVALRRDAARPRARPTRCRSSSARRCCFDAAGQRIAA